MSMKQTQQEYERGIAWMEKQLLPAKLKATSSNANMATAWLQRHCADENGVVDASGENLVKAIKALHAKSMIEWEVSPRPEKLVQQSEHREKPDSSAANVASVGRLVNGVMEQLDAKRERDATASAEGLLRDFGSGMQSHGKRAAAKEKLRVKWEQLLKTLKPSQALPLLQEFAKGLW